MSVEITPDKIAEISEEKEEMINDFMMVSSRIRGDGNTSLSNKVDSLIEVVKSMTPEEIVIVMEEFNIYFSEDMEDTTSQNPSI